MIEVDRSTLRLFRTALRKTLLLGRRNVQPSVLVQTGPTGLLLQSQHLGMALAWQDARPRPAAQVVLPASALKELDGKGVVTLVAEDPGVRAHWHDANIPRTATYCAQATEVDSGPLQTPDEWAPHETQLLNALHEATLSAAPDGVRYGLHRIQLRGASGDAVATDGRQLLLQSGFQFPWKENVLVEKVQLFGWSELRRDSEFQIGRTDQQVCIRTGPWKLWLPIDKESRYPDVQKVIPQGGDTVLHLHQDDASFMSNALASLPDADLDPACVTLDLSGQVAIRFRNQDPSPATEVRLSRSTVHGTNVQISLGRSLLARALSLGFRECLLVDAVTPVLFSDGHRKFVVMPFPRATIIRANDNDIRIDSMSPSSATPYSSAEEKTPMAPDQRASVPAANSEPIREKAELLEEAQSLHKQLREALARSQRLVAHLKVLRRQAKNRQASRGHRITIAA